MKRKIKNFEQIATTPERRAALMIAEAGLQAIDTKVAIREGVQLTDNILRIRDQSFDLRTIKRIYVVGIGKCAIDAAEELENILGDRITDGIVLDVRLPTGQAGEGVSRRIKMRAGTHPLPSQKNVDATREIIELLSGRDENDLILFIISGGGSALLCQPAHRTGRSDNFTYLEEATLINCLMKSGADIIEENTARKHLSLARGGYLAKCAYPALVVSLIFSDVPGGDLEFVASGPTVLDTTSIADAEAILYKYKTGVKCEFPATQLIETPKEKKYFARVNNILFVSNKLALEAMAAEAARQGFDSRIRDDRLIGEARAASHREAELISAEKPGTILLFGGETTVMVRGKGKGGRNMEMALAALEHLSDDELIVTMASDGRDNTDYAGAICDKYTKEKARELGLREADFLMDNDSYDFFKKTGDFLLTGHTGSNVADLSFMMKFKK